MRYSTATTLYVLMGLLVLAKTGYGLNCDFCYGDEDCSLGKDVPVVQCDEESVQLTNSSLASFIRPLRTDLPTIHNRYECIHVRAKSGSLECIACHGDRCNNVPVPEDDENGSRSMARSSLISVTICSTPEQGSGENKRQPFEPVLETSEGTNIRMDFGSNVACGTYENHQTFEAPFGRSGKQLYEAVDDDDVDDGAGGGGVEICVIVASTTPEETLLKVRERRLRHSVGQMPETIYILKDAPKAMCIVVWLELAASKGLGSTPVPFVCIESNCSEGCGVERRSSCPSGALRVGDGVGTGQGRSHPCYANQCVNCISQGEERTCDDSGESIPCNEELAEKYISLFMRVNEDLNVEKADKTHYKCFKFRIVGEEAFHLKGCTYESLPICEKLLKNMECETCQGKDCNSLYIDSYDEDDDDDDGRAGIHVSSVRLIATCVMLIGLFRFTLWR
uniref:4Fe-4S ferredoxin-type domain-containing protein n=1 Tax=Anopheles culicifacies TaxID=139723 RepID=A0A182MW64_9DIPT